MFITFLIITFICSIISGMGIGGGSIYILLCTIFNVFSHKEAQSYNLIMFIVVGIFATITNIKNKNFDKDLFKKLFIPVIIGSFSGAFLVKLLNEDVLKYIFYGFMLLIGTYEIISSLKSIKKAKDNNVGKEV